MAKAKGQQQQAQPAAAMEASSSGADDLMPSDEDLLYEEELLRNPFNLKMWGRYLAARTDAPAKRRYLLFERAIRALPGSFKVSHFCLLHEAKGLIKG